MFHSKCNSKIKNDKILRWRLELSCYKFHIIYHPGSQNTIAYPLSRICCTLPDLKTLSVLHNSLCHPGVTRFYHWVHSRNLPFSLEEIKKLTASCPTCAELKPKFLAPSNYLIKAMSSFERLDIDFKGPLPSKSRNRYHLTIIDEYSRFPFVFPCPDVSSSTVIKCLHKLFAIFGAPSYIHSDRGAAFLSHELHSFLTSIDIASSFATPYNPQGNGLIKCYNGIIWKTISLTL
ncbi:uncharacterized protein [Centruroides vittatus]|uniref:uncharacterized protein n=1 Tax=Centruroides vittatus TaxID=120091 RepID=UPI0035105233